MHTYLVIIGSKCEYLRANDSFELMQYCNKHFGRPFEYAHRIKKHW